MCSDSPPPAPPAPGPDPLIGQAALANAEISRDVLAYWREKDAAAKPFMDKAAQIALDQSAIQIETSKKQNEYADESNAYLKDTFRPLEKRIVSDAMGYDTPERRDAEAAQAQADIGTAGDAGRANMAREVLSRGGDVNSGNYTAGLAGMTTRESALKAAGGNQARKGVEAVGGAKLADAANLGRNLVSNNATQTQLGLNAGNSAVGNAQVPGNLSNQQVQMNNQTGSTAMQGNSAAGNLMLGQYGQQSANARSDAQIAAGGSGDNTMQTVGQIAGIAAMFLSDKKTKKDRKPYSGKVALSEVRKTPVESWRYKKGAVANDDGSTRVGPMAQDVQRTMGNETAPGGTMIDAVSIAGKTLAAVKEIDKRVMRLEDAKRPRRAARH